MNRVFALLGAATGLATPPFGGLIGLPSSLVAAPVSEHSTALWLLLLHTNSLVCHAGVSCRALLTPLCGTAASRLSVPALRWTAAVAHTAQHITAQHSVTTEGLEPLLLFHLVYVHRRRSCGRAVISVVTRVRTTSNTCRRGAESRVRNSRVLSSGYRGRLRRSGFDSAAPPHRAPRGQVIRCSMSALRCRVRSLS